MMHGDMVQGARDRVMKRFRAGEVQHPGGHRRRRPRHRRDAASRTSSTTTFRSRPTTTSTASAAPAAWAATASPITFVTTEEGGELTRIEMLINRLLKRDEIEGFDAVATVAPRPLQQPLPVQMALQRMANPPLRTMVPKRRRNRARRTRRGSDRADAIAADYNQSHSRFLPDTRQR